MFIGPEFHGAREVIADDCEMDSGLKNSANKFSGMRPNAKCQLPEDDVCH